ncbi:hypothetical protein TNCV_4858401 [Trichonephila clavipes]|nr:hypothetical protein TNCV_4858401 [Trichonephila clavipes]
MASGSDMTPIYSRSQSEVQGDLHKRPNVLYWIHVWRTRWPFHSYDSFLEKEILHQVSTMWPAVIVH